MSRILSFWCKGPPIKSPSKTFSTVVRLNCLEKLSKKMAYWCIACKKFVNKRQEALLCNGCNKWQHRTCNSGVSRETYRDAVRSGEDIPWKCESGSASRAILPNFESTMNEGTKIFTVIFGEKGRDIATCTQQRTKKSVKDR